MQNNYKVGRMITLIFYFIEGLMTVLVNVLQKKDHLGVSLAILGVWIVSFWMLFRMNEERKVSRRAYYIAEAFFSGVMACALAYATENMYFLLFVFWAQWMAYTLFLDKLACRITLGMHIFFVYIITFAAKSGFYFRVQWNSAMVEVLVLAAIWWLDEILINVINSQNRLNREQEMSLDDMLKLVEAMCEEAQLATKSKSVFLSNMSHEIRTPINTVLGMNEMIIRECEDKQILSYAKNIQSSGKTLLFLINDILDMTKIESGRMNIVPTEYYIADVLVDLWNLIYLRAQEKGLTVDFVVDETMPRKLFGDDMRIKQIVTNLLTNAVKYTQKGGIVLHASYERTGGDSMNLIISVKDTGMGIKKEDMGLLFESFQRLDEEKNRNIEGTGLGMNITRSLLSLMKGDIKVESEYHKGSTFMVTIPQKMVDGEATGDFEQIMKKHRMELEGGHESFEAPRANVLVVDDNTMNLIVFEALLKRTRMNIVTADSGKKCLEFVKKESFDIIFMDHMMPGMDGIETLAEIKKLGRSINEKTPVIALTANAGSGAREFYLKEGFADFLAKPIDADLLEQMIVSYLPEELVQIKKSRPADIKQDATAEKISQDKGENKKFILLREKGLHTENGLQYCRGDQEFYEELLIKFVNDAERKIEDIEDAFKNEGIIDYQIMVHALKSSSKMIGANTLSELAKGAEDAAKKQDLSYIREHHGELIDKYRETAQVILDVLCPSKEVTEKEDQADLTEISKEDLAEKLRELKEGLDTFEADKAETLLGDMNSLIYDGTPVRELLGDVRQDVDDFEFGAASEKVETLIRNLEGGEA